MLAEAPVGSKFADTKKGNGILQFLGPNIAGGNIEVANGALWLVNGKIPGMLTMDAGTVLKGTGMVVGGVKGPGANFLNKPPKFRSGDDPGFLIISNGFDLSYGELVVDLLGTSAADMSNDYSQIQVTGGTTATLSISLDYALGPDDVFLIDNQDGTPFIGSFTNTYQIYDPSLAL